MSQKEAFAVDRMYPVYLQDCRDKDRMDGGCCEMQIRGRV